MWAYQMALWANFLTGGVIWSIHHVLTNGHPTNLLGTEVQEALARWKDLRAANQVAKASSRDIHFFRVVTPTESPKVMGVKGIHSFWGPVMVRWPFLLPLVWQGGGEQGDGGKPFVDYPLPPGAHLCPLPGLLYYQCRCHASSHPHICKSNTVGDDDDDDDDREEEDYEDNDNGYEDNEFMFEED